jgi:predicted ribonuclease YlaK
MYWKLKELFKKVKVKVKVKVKERLAVVLDTNIIFMAAEVEKYLENLNIEIFIPWPVLEEMIKFRRFAFRQKDDREHLSERSKCVLRSWPLFAEAVESCKWKLCGSRGSEFKKAEKNGGWSIGVNDTRILSAAIALKEKGRQVILMTKDRDLLDLAIDQGLQATNSFEELKELAGK